MSRFSWLEIEEKKDKPPGAKPGPSKFDAGYYLTLADKHMRAGQFREALLDYSNALREDETLEAAWAGQALALVALEEYREAEVWIDQGLSRFKDSPELLSAKAVCVAVLESPVKGLAYSDVAIEKGNASAFCWIGRGHVLLLLGNIQNAKMCFMKAEEAGMGDPYISTMIGRAFLSAGKAEHALKYFIKALQNGSNEVFLFLQMGNANRELGFHDTAREYYEKVLELEPYNEEASNALGEIMRKEDPVSALFRKIRDFFSSLFGRKNG